MNDAPNRDSNSRMVRDLQWRIGSAFAVCLVVLSFVLVRSYIGDGEDSVPGFFDHIPRLSENSAEVTSAVEGSNAFAAELYARLAADKDKNLFFSPYSLSTALAMTSIGAAGETKEEMAKLLHFPASESELHFANHYVLASITSNNTSGIQLRVANRLWGQSGFHFEQQFQKVTELEYGAKLGLLDFKQSEVARTTINSWIEKQTDRKIQNLIGPGILNQDTRLVLTNAVYFYANWRDKFQKHDTRDAPFYVSETQETTVPMMHQTRRFSYTETDSLEILEFPYAGDIGLSMLILLPKNKYGLSELENQLSSENLQKWTANLKLKNVTVGVPKIRLSLEFALDNVLKSMGMTHAFSRSADFSRMSNQEELFITNVIHKAFVDVNESGTEAAAATAIAAAVKSEIIADEPYEFIADHPFVFLIRHNRTRAILFLGRLANPALK